MNNKWYDILSKWIVNLTNNKQRRRFFISRTPVPKNLRIKWLYLGFTDRILSFLKLDGTTWLQNLLPLVEIYKQSNYTNWRTDLTLEEPRTQRRNKEEHRRTGWYQRVYYTNHSGTIHLWTPWLNSGKQVLFILMKALKYKT